MTFGVFHKSLTQAQLRNLDHPMFDKKLHAGTMRCHVLNKRSSGQSSQSMDAIDYEHSRLELASRASNHHTPVRTSTANSFPQHLV